MLTNTHFDKEWKLGESILEHSIIKARFSRPLRHPQAKVGHQKNTISFRNEPALVFLPCLIIGWEHSFRSMGSVKMWWNILELRGWGPCLIKLPIFEDPWGAFSVATILDVIQHLLFELSSSFIKVVHHYSWWFNWFVQELSRWAVCGFDMNNQHSIFQFFSFPIFMCHMEDK